MSALSWHHQFWKDINKVRWNCKPDFNSWLSEDEPVLCWTFPTAGARSTSTLLMSLPRCFCRFENGDGENGRIHANKRTNLHLLPSNKILSNELWTTRVKLRGCKFQFPVERIQILDISCDTPCCCCLTRSLSLSPACSLVCLWATMIVVS